MASLKVSVAIRLSRYERINEYDDGGYSALHRPGSWEWQTDEAEAARRRLSELGYCTIVDPTADYLVRWVAS